MAVADHLRIEQRVDAAFQWGGLVVRTLVFLALGSLAEDILPVRAVLVGVLAGDGLGRLVGLLADWRHDRRATLAELGLLAITALWLRPWLEWPAEPALQAVLVLAGVGTVAGELGPWLRSFWHPVYRGVA
jgi:hypothetical protein